MNAARVSRATAFVLLVGPSVYAASDPRGSNGFVMPWAMAETQGPDGLTGFVLPREWSQETDPPGTAEDPSSPSFDQAALERAVEQYLAARADSEPPPHPLLERLSALSVFGDLRLRQEANFHLDQGPNRHRTRLRLRFGANYQAFDELLVGLRLTTGDRTDPRSAHVTFGSGFDRFEITLDRAFVQYRRDGVLPLELTAGKFAHPFALNPVYGELVWDGDLQPEGAAARLSLPSKGPLRSAALTGGAYWLIEQGAAEDTMLFVAESRVGLSLPKETDATLSLAWYEYRDPTPKGSHVLFRDNAGNATIDRDGDGNADDFRSDFGIAHAIVSLSRMLGTLPMTWSVEAAHNARARGGRDDAFAIGASLGQRRNRGDWRGYYQWQVIQQEAVFSPFTQDDFLLATNFRGHVAGVQYQLADKAGLHLWALVAARDHRDQAPRDRDQWRVRLDLDLRF